MIIATILEQRGIARGEQERFLRPDFEEDLEDGAVMKGMARAVARLQRAAEQKEDVVVFGDYDADGVPGTALCVRGLRACGLQPRPLIPLRSDGYGLTPEAVRRILAQPPAVLITVDNGTVAQAEITTLTEAGSDVIVIDHHEAPAEAVTTAAYALINPKQPGCPYPFKELCGCGLVWKLLHELYRALGRPTAPLKWELDLVALSTVADMVPLVGENRVLTWYGLKVAAKSRNVGFRALAEVAGVPLDPAAPLSAGDIGFKLAPRINAPSRMHQETVGEENAALQLLLTSDPAEAAELAGYLNKQNSERQLLVDHQVEEAQLQAATAGDAPVLVVYGETWSTGVIGLVASRLMEQYHRPVIALAPEKTDAGKVVKGSVRSCADVQALDLLQPVVDLIERYGGHAKAAGLTLKSGEGTAQEQVARFCQHVLAAVKEQGITLAAIQAGTQRTPDLTLSLAEADLELAEALEELAPFGLGFPTPVFRSLVTVEVARTVGRDGKHLSCRVSAEGTQRKAMAFGQGEQSIQVRSQYEITYTLAAETWQGTTAPVCYIKQLTPIA